MSNTLPPFPWTAPSAAVYAADGKMVCSLGSAEVVKAFRARGDGNGSMIMATAEAIASIPDLTSTLIQAVESSGFSLSGPTDIRAAENGEPVWVCNARALIAKVMA